MASFNGLDLGLIEEWSTTVAPKDRQINAYPGVNGLEIIDLGGRGGQTSIRGVVSGVDAPGLAAVKGAFRDLQFDGGAYAFVDPEGTTWTSVILVMFRTVGPRKWLSGARGYCQRYDAELLHTGD